jgi:pyridoxamine 5'-phosphate oxidase
MRFPEDSPTPVNQQELSAQISSMRRSYGEVGIADGALPDDPIEAISLWLAEAAGNPLVVEPNAMVLATVDAQGRPRSRTVLLKGIDERGLTFFTNYRSRKGADINVNPWASLLFPWYSMERQLIVSGSVEQLSTEESEEYFQSRPWGHQIGALASDQSQPLPSRGDLERRWREAAAEFPDEGSVPRPESWGGYLVRPDRVEFWQGRYSRLHDRLVFDRAANGWNSSRLYP